MQTQIHTQIQTLRIEYKSLQQASGMPMSQFNQIIYKGVRLNPSPANYVEVARAYVALHAATIDSKPDEFKIHLPPSITGSKGLWV